MNREDTFKAELKKSNLSFTNSRKLIFRSLLSGKPIRASKLADNLKKQVDRATVYRTLDTFEEIGLVRRTWLGFKSQYELAELFLPHHHHLTCIKCGNVETIDDKKIEAEISRLAERVDFKIKDHLLEVSGLCAKCHR